MFMDLRAMIRFARSRQEQPSSVVLNGRTLQSGCESGPRRDLRRLQAQARQQGAHGAVNTLGHLLAVLVTPTNEQERAQVFELREAVQTASDHTGRVGLADQGYAGQQPR